MARPPMAEREQIPLSMGGFGREARDAMRARAEYLAGERLARRQGRRVTLQRDLLNTLRRGDAVGKKLSVDTGLAHVKATAGEHVSGTYRQRLMLPSGRFAMIDNGLGFPTGAMVGRDRAETRPARSRRL